MAVIIDDKDYTTTSKKEKGEEHLIIGGDSTFVIKLGVKTRSENDTKENYDSMIKKAIEMLQDFSISQGCSHLDVMYVLIEDN
jgi:hypothetical protein